VIDVANPWVCSSLDDRGYWAGILSGREGEEGIKSIESQQKTNLVVVIRNWLASVRWKTDVFTHIGE